MVNPFNVDRVLQSQGEVTNDSEIVQVFDDSVNLIGDHPNTVTTNAGDRTKFLEINPQDLILSVSKYFPNTLKASISIPDPRWLGENIKYKIRDEWLHFPPPTGPKIGILTGNSPESGLMLWNDFLEQFRNIYNNLTDVLMPEVLVHSLPQMGLSMELAEREDEVWLQIEEAIKQLLKNGCKLITLACNTTIYFEPKISKLCKAHNARFVSIAEACLPAIKEQTLESDKDSLRVGLVGIGPVVDFEGGYSGYEKQFTAEGIEAVPCDATDLAYLIKSIGTHKKPEAGINKLSLLIEKQLDNTAVVVLSLTEVSLIYRKGSKKHKYKKVYIDPISELARFLVYLYVLNGLKESAICQIPDSFNLESKLNQIMYSKFH